MVDPKIVQFIAKHHVLTLATGSVVGGCVVPYCSNMFYAYLPEQNVFVFTSSDQTRHVSDVEVNPQVGGSIVLETKTVGNVQGLQLMGTIRRIEGSDKGFKVEYLKKYPYAALMPLELWVVEPTYMKLTDNRLGFGKKIIWTKNEK